VSHVLAVGGGGFRHDERWQRRPGPPVEHAVRLSGKEGAPGSAAARSPGRWCCGGCTGSTRVAPHGETRVEARRL
jgi:hypothetical protein